MDLEEFKFEQVKYTIGDQNSSRVNSSQQDSLDNDSQSSCQIFRVYLSSNNQNIHVVMKVSYHPQTIQHQQQLYSNNQDFPSIFQQVRCTHQCNLIKNEWQVLQNVLPHPNVIQTFNVFENVQCFTKQHYSNSGCCAIQMEEAQMDLYDFVVKVYNPNKGAQITKLIDFYRQVALGLEHIHSQGFAHNDIKSENILIFGEELEKAKVADFGLANNIDAYYRIPQRERIRKQVNQWKSRNMSHAAPEILDTLKHQEEAFDERQSDVFAFGVSLFESIFGMRPFHQSVHKSDLIYKNFITKKQFYHFWKTNTQIKQVVHQIKRSSVNIDLLADFLHRCLQPSPKLRLSSQELVTHDLFD